VGDAIGKASRPLGLFTIIGGVPPHILPTACVRYRSLAFGAAEERRPCDIVNGDTVPFVREFPLARVLVCSRSPANVIASLRSDAVLQRATTAGAFKDKQKERDTDCGSYPRRHNGFRLKLAHSPRA
jgi:hypothetical protein